MNNWQENLLRNPKNQENPFFTLENPFFSFTLIVQCLISIKNHSTLIFNKHLLDVKKPHLLSYQEKVF